MHACSVFSTLPLTASMASACRLVLKSHVYRRAAAWYVWSGFCCACSCLAVLRTFTLVAFMSLDGGSFIASRLADG